MAVDSAFDLRTLLGYELSFSPSRVVVRLRHHVPIALDEAAAVALQKVFQSRLHVEQLRVEMDWVPPEPPPAPAKKPKPLQKAGRR
ncbi:MAG: hypothetical protein JJE04_23535 [Acidobacteriia bacterium]|nr:hypothetical protein [Terriglobia bacterium]